MREDAAALYASGSSSAAEDLLLSHITRSRGTCPRTVWLMLLDLYQATRQKTSFEKLAQFFASHFDTSPPAWVDTSPAAAPRTPNGLNALVVDGPLHTLSPEKVRQFLSHARRVQTARLDVSRARVPETDVERLRGLKTLLDILRKLRRYRVPTLLMGETKLAEHMRQVVAAQIHDKAPVSEEAKISWNILLEFLQWRAQLAAFDELADAYALRFSESPPDYEEEGVVAIAPDDRPLATRPPDAGETVTLPATVELAEMSDLIPVLEETLDRYSQLRLDARLTERVSYEAGVALATFFHARSPTPTAVVIVQPSELVVALLEITGVSGFASVEPRKR